MRNFAQITKNFVRFLLCINDKIIASLTYMTSVIYGKSIDYNR